MAPIFGLIAHGGTTGLIFELATAVLIAGIALAVWVGSRGDREEP
jgi:hypothetical protein